MPLWYSTGAVAEHRGVITAAGLFDTSHMALVTVSGPKAHGLLQKCFTQDLDRYQGRSGARLPPGRAVYGAFLDENGGALDDALVYRTGPEDYLIVVNAGMSGRVTAHLAAQAVEAAGIVDLGGQVGKVDLQGPQAARILARVIQSPDEVLQGLPYFSFKGHFDPDAAVAGVKFKDGTPVLLSRTGYSRRVRL